MRGVFLTIQAVILSALLCVAPASAQQTDGNALRDLLELIIPEEGNMRPAPEVEQGAERRVPLSNQEVQLSFAPLVSRTAPSVVNVYATRQVTQRRSPFADDPFFDQFFGRQFSMPPRAQSSLGSGVIVDAAGLVVTNNHVIEGADEVRVALSDGREFESTVVLRDEASDLAVLRINAGSSFVALPFGNSDALLTGDLVLAIGNPFGVGQTITSGIISAVARTQVGVSDFGFFIQTDAAINPGNSGGALVDMNGNLIGINTAIFSRSGGSNGIGFAIPSNMVRAVVAQAAGGSAAFERPYMGAEFEPVTPSIAEALGMERPRGALVVDVIRNGPADDAGLRPGDVVLAVNDVSVEHPDALGYRLATIGPGGNAQLEVLSQQRRRQIDIRLQNVPAADASQMLTVEKRSPFAGATLANITPRIARRLKLRSAAQGVVVTDVQRGSFAARGGIRPGDVIVAINGAELLDVGVAADAIDASERNWRFVINRQGRLIRQFIRF